MEIQTEFKNYSKVYRIIHWAIAFSFMFLLITIFLRLTWMNKNNMADIIQTYLTGIGQTLPQEQAVAMAKKIRQPMWMWHIYTGYVLVGLFSVRLILALFGKMKIQNPFDRTLSIKIRFQNSVYILFYICVATSLTTGLLIVFGPANLKEPLEDIHVLGIYYLLAYITIHLGGVMMAEFTNQKGIITRIISGTGPSHDKSKGSG